MFYYQFEWHKKFYLSIKWFKTKIGDLNSEQTKYTNSENSKETERFVEIDL